MKTRIAMLMMGALAVGGCANVEPQMNRGIVKDKYYSVAWDETVKKCDKYIKSKPKKPANCAKWKSHVDHHDMGWHLLLQDGDRTGEVTVSLVVYQAYKVGDRYNG